MGEIAIKTSLITLRKAVITYFWAGSGLLFFLFLFFFFFWSHCLMIERVGDTKTGVPDTASISDNVIPKIILLYKN